MDEEGVGQSARRISPISGARATVVATLPADAVEVDLEGDTPGHRGPRSQRRAGTQKTLKSAAEARSAFDEVLINDSGRFVDMDVRMGLLAEVRGIGDTVARSEVVVWARTLAKHVRSGHREISYWVAVVVDFRAWEAQRGVIRVFAP